MNYRSPTICFTVRPDTLLIVVALVSMSLLSGCGGREDRTDGSTAQSPVLASGESLWRLRNLGRAHFDDNALDEAAAVFRQCVEAGDTYADHLDLGITLVRAGELEEGRSALERALELDPEAIAPHYVLGVAANRSGHSAVARRELEQVTGSGQVDAAVWYQLGLALRAEGSSEEAEEAFGAATALDQEHVSAHYQIFLLMRERGATDAARARLDQVKELRAVVPDFKRSDEALAASMHTELIVAPPERVASDGGEYVFELMAVSGALYSTVSAGDDLIFEPGDTGRGGVVLVRDDRVERFSLDDATGEAAFVRDGATDQISGPRFELGDFDHDGLPELCVPIATGVSLEVGGEEVAELLDIGEPVARPLALDHDHDGDLDLFVWVAAGDALDVIVCVNEGMPRADSRLRFAVRRMDAWRSAGRPTAVEFADLNHDGAVDVLELHAGGGSRAFVNRRRGVFELDPALAATIGGNAMAFGDIDGDGLEDAIVAADWGVDVFAFDGGVTRLDHWLPASVVGADDVALIDLDNDGDLDAVLGGDAGARSDPLRVWSNTGSRFESASVSMPTVRGGVHAVRAGDLDADGRIDLACVDDAGVTLWLNRTDPRGRSMRVRLVGGRSAGDGRGSTIELRAGPVSALRRVRGPVTTLAAPSGTSVDVLRLVWPNGAIQSIIDPIADEHTLSIEEKKEVAGSCPILYAWTGARFEMATDLMGTAPLGYPVGPDTYLTPHPQELVKIPAKAMPVPSNGLYRLVLAEELREIVYLDRFRLWTVDHPDSIAVFSNYLLSDPPFEEPALIALRGAHPPLHAVDQHGQDVTELLAKVDRRTPVPFDTVRDPFQGLATSHTLTLDFGRLDALESPVLVLTGFTDWTDGPSEAAISQHRDLRADLPMLDVEVDGAWRSARAWFGVPSLKSKDIAIDLSDAAVAGATRLRLRTNLRTYWDRALIGDRLDEVEAKGVIRDRVHVPREAELVHKGTSIQRSPDGALPLVFDYDERRPSVWRSQSGLATRYGDVRALLDAADDRCVVFTIGDAVTCTFDAFSEPELPVGWSRSAFVESHGWEKEGDYYTALGMTVEPLPYRAMPGYPYAPGVRPALDDAMISYELEYNTRVIGGRRAVADPAGSATDEAQLERLD